MPPSIVHARPGYRSGVARHTFNLMLTFLFLALAFFICFGPSVLTSIGRFLSLRRIAGVSKSNSRRSS